MQPDLFCQLNEFYTRFENCRHIFGYSVFNEPLYCFDAGGSGKKVLVMAGCHANEYITALIACRFFEELSHSEDKYPGKFSVIPLLNPDGVKVCLSGNKKYRGNGRGVDLNRNFKAGWDKIPDVPEENPYFKGPYAESEPESAALCRLCEKENFDAVCALHAQGEVIYSGFDGRLPFGEPEFSDKISKITGYPVMFASGNESYGGFKDWFIEKYNLPGVTVECGFGENPLPLSSVEDICRKVVPALLALG